MEGIFREEANKLINDGIISYYHENGILRETGMKEEGKQRGIWKTYYETGIPESEIDYKEDETLYIQHWDEHGKPELKDGTGIHKSRGYKGVPNYNEIEGSKLVTVYEVNNTDTVYIVVQKAAEFPGGMPELYKYIASCLKYPANARRSGVQGSVFVAFVVTKDGRVTSPEVVKGIGGGCDEAAIDCFISEMKWEPGLVRGKPVNSKFVLPIKFKLG
jgi:TonB family protein